MRRLLGSALPEVLRVEGAPGTSDTDLVAKQQSRLMALAVRTMALSFGRAAFSLGAPLASIHDSPCHLAHSCIPLQGRRSPWRQRRWRCPCSACRGASRSSKTQLSTWTCPTQQRPRGAARRPTSLHGPNSTTGSRPVHTFSS